MDKEVHFGYFLKVNSDSDSNLYLPAVKFD